MKYLTLIFACLLLISCSKVEESKDSSVDCTDAEYNLKFLASLDDEICFRDGQSFIIKNIEDLFCPCEAVCIWGGELSVLIETVTPTGEKDLVRFGSESYKDNSEVFSESRIEAFTFTYETGDLPDCEKEFDPTKVRLNINIIKE